MPVVRIPTVLRKHTGGNAKVETDGATVGEVFAQLVAEHPGLQDALFEGDALRGYVNVYVEDEDTRYLDGLGTPVDQDTEVAIMPAVAGGAGRLGVAVVSADVAVVTADVAANLRAVSAV